MSKLDPKVVLGLVENDCSFAESLIDKVFETLESDIKDLQDLLAKGDFENLEINAHSIKGASRIFGPSKFMDVSYLLECAASEKDSEACKIHLKNVVEEKSQFCELLNELRKEIAKM